MAASEPSTQNFAALDPDVRLMLEVRDDSGPAFEQLVMRHQARLITVLEHMVGRRDVAEDLAQEVFLRVYRSRKRYEPNARFATWFYTIANNVARNSKRSQARRREVTLDGGSGGEAPGAPLESLALERSGLMPARQFDKAELADVVRKAVATLSERQRLAVLLSKFEGLSYAEIGAAMDLSAPAVKSLLTRARLNLKNVLDPYLQDGAWPAAGAPQASAIGDDDEP